MKFRIIAILIAVLTALSLLTGCGGGTTPTASPSPSAKPSATASPLPSPSAGSPGPSQTTADTTTSASIVNTASAFQNAISKNGTWIICLTKDLAIDTPLTVDGNFMNTKTPPASQRKIALYAQDENRNVTARYTLTAPKMTINSVDCAIWNGTFKGDLYVAANNFQLIGATVSGNVFFASESIKGTFKMDAASKITGAQGIKAP